MTKRITTAAAGLLAIVAASMAPGAAHAATATATVNAKIVKPLVLTGGGTIGLGNIYTPSAATFSGTFNIAPAAAQGGSYCATGFTCTGAVTAAMFNMQGTNNTPITVTIPLTVTLTNTAVGSATMTLNTTNSIAANSGTGNYSTSLPNSGAPGTDFYVGGSVVVSNSTVEGSYQGTFTVIANYQ